MGSPASSERACARAVDVASAETAGAERKLAGVACAFCADGTAAAALPAVAGVD